MNICVIGAGYVGLTVALCFAKSGHKVACVDIDKEKIRSLKGGIVPFYEPGLGEMLRECAAEDKIKFFTDIKQGARDAGVCFITVDTPPKKGGGADTKNVLSVARSLSELAPLRKSFVSPYHYFVVVIKSTVPPGTADRVSMLMKQWSGFEFDVVSNPEFLREGWSIDDFLHPNRIIIGSRSQTAASIMEELYRGITDSTILFMDPVSAEMVKYASNAYLAMKISFINEMSMICDMVGADIDQVRKGIGADSRIGSAFLSPGIGYGGSCLGKDMDAIIGFSKARSRPSLLPGVVDVNKKVREEFVNVISRYIDEVKKKLEGTVKIAVFGVSFKPWTSDTRDSPAVYVINKILRKKVDVFAFDPACNKMIEKMWRGKVKSADMYGILKGADALVVATDWPEFYSIDLNMAKELMRTPAVFDGRGCIDSEKAKRLGFKYCRIGKEASDAKEDH